jgi:hypothetical protein
MEARAGSKKKTNINSETNQFSFNNQSTMPKRTKSNKYVAHYTELSVTEKAFHKGVGQFDAEAERVKKIFSEQIMENR